jgi:hypothetical protein
MCKQWQQPTILAGMASLTLQLVELEMLYKKWLFKNTFGTDEVMLLLLVEVRR